MSPGTNQVRTVRPDKASRIMTPAVKPPPTATNRPSGDHETAALGVQTSPYSGSTFEISETVIGGAVAIPKGSTDAISRANPRTTARRTRDRKSTRLNSSHLGISYAVFCLKKKKKIQIQRY